MTPEERDRLTQLVALDNNDDLWEAVRLCAQLKRRELEPSPFATIQSVLEEVGDLTESGPVNAAPWERVRDKLVPALRRVIQSPDEATASDLFHCWTRLKQEEPLR
jgi:hypothetical protein